MVQRVRIRIENGRVRGFLPGTSSHPVVRFLERVDFDLYHHGDEGS